MFDSCFLRRLLPNDFPYFLKSSPMPPIPLLWLVLFSSCCNGSLVSVRSVDVMCFTIQSDLGCGCCQFWFPKVLFVMIGASTLAPLGTIVRSGGTSEHKKGYLGAQVFFRFWIDLGSAVSEFWQLWSTKCVFVMRVYRSHFYGFRGLFGDVGGGGVLTPPTVHNGKSKKGKRGRGPKRLKG